MIHVTRLDGSDVVVNADLIATIERTPDTNIALVTGARLMVREPVEEVVEKVVQLEPSAIFPAVRVTTPALLIVRNP